MLVDKKIWTLILQLWGHLSLRRRRQFCMLLAVMILASLTEVISIGTVIPFLGAITAPEKIFAHPEAAWFIRELRLAEPSELLLPLTIIFCVAVVSAGTMRLMLVWISARLTYAAGTDLSFNIYRRTLYQSYAAHCERNSSEVIDGILSKSSNAIGIIGHCATIISACIMALSIIIALLTINTIIALTTFFGFGLSYYLIIILSRRTLLVDSKTVASQSVNVIKSLQEGLGGIRDVLINGSQEYYCQIYKSADVLLRRAQGRIAFISSSPRYGMEALGMLLIAVISYSLACQEDGITRTIPILGALALGAQRLLPVMQQAYGSWTSILGGQFALKGTLELLNQPLPNFVNQSVPNSMPFKHSILIRGVNFSYSPTSPVVLKGIDLTIYKGARVGFIGITGSGKSTLLDLIMALLQPTRGSIEVDGINVFPGNQCAWQQNIAHVPQSIFMADCSIEENIAFGAHITQIDRGRVRQAAQRAQISATIEGWPNQYATIVGERGVRLSGGQRQRIGIARALYRHANVIIFDEATSALDFETERTVMDTIATLSKELTIIIVAHRISTLAGCTQIVELSEGIIKRVGSYKDIVG